MPESAPVRVCHIGPDPDQLGGMETVLRAYSESSWPGFEMDVVSSSVRGSVWQQLATVTDAARRILSSDSDYFHVHLSHRGSFIREGALAVIASLRSPTFATVHGSSFVETAGLGGWRALYRFVLNRLSGVAALNDDSFRTLTDLAPKTPTMMLSNPGPVAPAPQAPTYQGEGSVLFAGRVGLRKGVDTLLNAWQRVTERHPAARLTVVGPLEEDLTPAQRAALSSYYAGELSPTELQAKLRSAACAVLPSRGEGQPMFLIEALAFGVPLVVTDVGGMTDLAAGTGIVVPVGDEVALSEALSLVLDDGPAIRTLRQNAIQKYAAEFSVEAHTYGLRALYAMAEA